MAKSKKPSTPSWRDKIVNRTKFDEERKGVYIEFLAATGRKAQAAKAAGVCMNTVVSHIDKDPEFAESVREALAQYADHIQEQVYVQAVEGVQRPLLGGKFKDKIVAHERIYATNLLAMEAKRINPEYKERQEIDMNVKGGVLVAPARMSAAEWAEQARAVGEDIDRMNADADAD